MTSGQTDSGRKEMEEPEDLEGGWGRSEVLGRLGKAHWRVRVGNNPQMLSGS